MTSLLRSNYATWPTHSNEQFRNNCSRIPTLLTAFFNIHSRNSFDACSETKLFWRAPFCEFIRLDWNANARAISAVSVIEVLFRNYSTFINLFILYSHCIVWTVTGYWNSTNLGSGFYTILFFILLGTFRLQVCQFQPLTLYSNLIFNMKNKSRKLIIIE